MTKQELIDQIAAVVIEDGSSITAGQRDYMMQQTIPWLEQKLIDMKVVLRQRNQRVEDTLAQVRAEAVRQAANRPEQQQHERDMEEGRREYYLAQIFRTQVVIGGKPYVAVQNKASENLIVNWLHPGETLNRDWFIRVLSEQPSLVSQLSWQSPDALDPQKIKDADKQTFVQAANTLRSFGVNEANFNLIRSVLGPGFTYYDIQNGLTANALQLALPSREESDQWAAEDIERHNQELLNANPGQLRARVRQEASDIRVQQAQAENDRQLEALRGKDAPFNYPALPSEFTKDSLLQMVRNDTKKFRFLVQKFGSFNITARLQSRG